MSQGAKIGRSMIDVKKSSMKSWGGAGRGHSTKNNTRDPPPHSASPPPRPPHDFNHAIGTPAENGRPHSRACPVLGRFHAENRPRAPNRLLPYGEKHWCGSVSVHLDLGSVRSLEHEAHPRRRRAQARRSAWRIQAHSGKTWGHNVEAVVGADQANTLSWCPLETSHSLVECAFLLRR